MKHNRDTGIICKEKRFYSSKVRSFKTYIRYKDQFIKRNFLSPLLYINHARCLGHELKSAL